MKKGLYIFAAFFILFLSVYGQPPEGDKRHAPPLHDKMLGPDPLQFFRRAGIVLTSEQTNRIYDIAIKFVREEEPIRAEIKKIFSEIKTELMKDKPDRNILKDLIYSREEKEAERDYLIILRDLDIMDMLTQEQKVQLNKHRIR